MRAKCGTHNLEGWNEEISMAGKKSIVKFSPSFRQSCKECMGWSEEEIRQLELETIKKQAKPREGVEEECNGDS